MMSDPNGRDRTQRSQNAEAEDPFTRSTRLFNHFQTLINTLWSLPGQIYQRGNEHGREFGKLIDERQRRHGAHEHESRSEREDEQEREDARGTRACGWHGKEAWKHTRDQQQRDGEQNTGVEESATSDPLYHQDWVARVTREVERNQREAERLYDDHESTAFGGQNKPDAILDEAQRALQGLCKSMGIELPTSASFSRASIDSEEKSREWSEIFPAWSSAAYAPSQHHEDEQDRDGQDLAKGMPRPGPIITGAQQIEDAMNQAQRDVKALMSGTSQIARLMKDGYNREARLWDEEGLFGAHMPFSRPLSAMLSLSMRPFMPEDSAMGYMLFSKYSPLHLEHEPGFDVTFRQRFEDLVRVQSGGAMIQENETHGVTKVEWLTRMGRLVQAQTPGVDDYESQFDPDQRPTDGQWTADWQHGTNPLFKQPSELTETEWDMYEEMLANGQHVRQRRIDEPDTKAFSEDDDNEEQETWQKLASRRPWLTSPLTEPNGSSGQGVLSTLTTTERHVSADGTVTEKTILKKRFADGREETESTTTTREANRTMAWARERQLENESTPVYAQQDSNIANEAKRSRGWFWSS